LLLEVSLAEALVLYEVDEAVSIVTLNRPDKRNALNDEVMEALRQAFAKADSEPSTSVVLLRARGPSFCAGYDISSERPNSGWRQDALKAHQHLSRALEFEMTPWEMKKPVVAAVHGHALGGGCELAMLCDLTVASEEATFGEPEIRFSTAGPAMVMPAIIGHKRARELLYFGDTIDARTALAYGMVNKVFAKATFEADSLKYAKRLALISPEALCAAKLSINRGAEATGFRTLLKVGLDVVAPLYTVATAFGGRFREIIKTDGVGAAVRWRRKQFEEQ
jgi:enoyl-CoA hydratase